MKGFGFKEPERLEGWIQVTRGKQDRSWLDRTALRTVRFLYYTSLFVCSAERYSQKFKIPSFVFQLYSKTISFRWKRKLFWLDWEIPLMRLLFRWFINPIDYKLPEDYGDHFTAKESDVQMRIPSGASGVTEVGLESPNLVLGAR